MDILIDTAGDVVIEPQFDQLLSPTCGLIACRDSPDGKWGFINLAGNLVIPHRYRAVGSFDKCSGTTWVTEFQPNGVDGYSLIDTNGNRITSEVYEAVQVQREGRSIYKQNGLYGYLDESGVPVIPARYAFAESFSCGLAVVSDPAASDYHYIDLNGHPQLGPFPGFPSYTASFQVGVARLESSESHSTKYIDISGKVVLELDPDLRGDPFSGGFAVILNTQSGLYGYIDPRGKVRIKPMFDSAFSFQGGWAKVTVGDKDAFVDAFGRPLPLPEDVAISTNPSCSRLAVYSPATGRYGVADVNGNLIVDTKYELVSQYSEGFASAELLSSI